MPCALHEAVSFTAIAVEETALCKAVALINTAEHNNSNNTTDSSTFLLFRSLSDTLMRMVKSNMRRISLSIDRSVKGTSVLAHHGSQSFLNQRQF